MKALITALLICPIPAAFAAPAACVAGTYASYQALSGGCSIGNAVFSSFSGLTFVNSPGVATLTPSEIEVTPSGDATDASLTFAFLNSSGALTPITVNQLGQIFSFDLSYRLLVAPGSLTGFEMNAAFSNTAPGSASATKTVEPVGGGTAVTSTVNDGGVSNPMGSYNGSPMPISANGPVLVTDTTSLQAQTGSVTESSFMNSFVQSAASGGGGGGGTVAAVPEMQSYAITGAGLVFLSLIASSRRKRQRARG